MLRRNFPATALGIGDKLSDAQAYVDNGMTAYLIPHYKQKPKDMRVLAAELATLRGQGRLQVVDNWGQIVQGIFNGEKFPPAAFIQNLRAGAAKLEADRRRDDD